MILKISEKTRRRVPDEAQAAPVKSTPANDDRKPTVISTKPPKPVPSPATEARPSATTARRPGKRYVDVPKMMPEEHQRRGDAADAIMQEFKRQIAEKERL